MDALDVRILNIIQRDNRLSTEKIALRVSSSPSAVQRRLKRLREEGIIEAELAIVSPEAVGLTVTAIVGVVIDKERPLVATVSKFKELMLNTPEVMQCYDVTGEFDFIVVVTARDMPEYDSISRRLFEGNSNVSRYKTALVLKRIKSQTAIPLPDHQP